MYTRPTREREANARAMTKSKVADEVMGEVENEVENVGDMAKEFGGWWWLLMEK
jgi:hypothetical protein